MSSVVIRTFEVRDTEAVIAIWNQALFDSAPHNDPALSLRKKLAVDRELLLVASFRVEEIVSLGKRLYSDQTVP